MENEIELDLDTELDQAQASADSKLKVKNRFEKLSEKVILTAKEKEAAEAKAKQEADARSKVEKERDFYRDFSQISSKYPKATEHQDKILERVAKGYSAKAATLEVLEEAGQLGGTPVVQTPTESPAGGSATISVTEKLDKSPEEMNVSEKRKALEDAFRGGDNPFVH